MSATTSTFRINHPEIDQKLSDSIPNDFTDVALDRPNPPLSTPVHLANGSRAAVPLDYSSSTSSSTTSSRTSSARSSTNSGSDDFDDLSDDPSTLNKRFYDYPGASNSAAAHQMRKLSSRRSSTVTVLSTSTVASSDEDEDLNIPEPNTYNPQMQSSQTSLAPSEYALTSNKLNGYLLHSLKSKSSLSLLNPNQASVKSRSSVQSFKEPALFDNSVSDPLSKHDSILSISTTSSSLSSTSQDLRPLSSSRSSTNLSSSFQNSRLSINTTISSEPVPAPYSPTIAKRFNRPYLKNSPSVSLLVQASQASQGLRISRSTSSPHPTAGPNSIVLPESANETDAFAPLPSSKRNLQRALSRSGAHSTPNILQTLDSSSKHSPTSPSTNSVSSAPSSGLTAQQRLRLRRSKSSNRLTTKQLELQFESEDLDDDIPSDSLVFNVPLSPALYVKTQQTKTAEAPLRQSRSSRKRNSSRNSPLSPTSQSNAPNSLASIKEAAPTLYFSNAGLENLSADARDLTVAFQQLPTANTFDQDLNRVNEHAASHKLPPKNPSSPFSNDSVPISKEKEAVLSRTRPSWLPPKSPEEERRHIIEYQQMMAHVSQLERKAEQRKEQERAAREKQRAKDANTWKTRILPNFEKAIEEPRTRELWWRGIPPKYRSIVWKARAGNNLGINKSTYTAALSRAKALVKAFKAGKQLPETESGLSREHEGKILAQLLQMEDDIALTYPDLKMFDAEIGPMHDSLVDILQAFAMYRPAIGYQRGLCYIAATLLLNLDTLDAFIALCNMLNHSLLQALYLHDERELTTYYQPFLKVLHTKMPSLYAHFKHIRLPPAAYLEPILMPLFACHCSSVDAVSRIWDVMFFEGDGFVLRAALGVLAKLEHKLYGGSAEEIMKILGWPKKSTGTADANAGDKNGEQKSVGASSSSLSGFEANGDEDSFMNAIRNILKN